MTAALDLYLPQGWQALQHPPGLFRRFQFASYAETSRFLDGLARLSEETGLFPDLAFSRTHVNVTVRREDGSPAGVREVEFAGRVGSLAPIACLTRA